MLRPFILSIISAVLVSASCDKEEAEKIQPACEVEATVVDLSKLDGCRFVFQLDDGTRLEPYITDCIILGVDNRYESDPMMSFEMSDGKRVKMAYMFLTDLNDERQLSICQETPIVKITCITETENSTTPP